MIVRNHYVLAVHDVTKSAAFYVQALGFAVIEEPPGWVLVEKDGCVIMLGECPDDLHPSKLGCHSWFGYLVVEDADEYRRQIAATGLAPDLGTVADRPWGMREFVVTTLDGHRLAIGHPISSPPGGEP